MGRRTNGRRATHSTVGLPVRARRRHRLLRSRVREQVNQRLLRDGMQQAHRVECAHAQELAIDNALAS